MPEDQNRHNHDPIFINGGNPNNDPLKVRYGQQVYVALDAMFQQAQQSSGDAAQFADEVEIVSRLEAAGNKHLHVDGGATIQRFLRSGLITEIAIRQIPVLLDAGMPLFGSIHVEMPLKHIETTSSRNGFVQSQYQVLHEASH